MPADFVRLRLDSDAFSCDALQVSELSGREAIGELFAFTIELVSLGSEELDLQQVEGAEASLAFLVEGDEVQRIYGMIAQIDDLLDTEPNTHSYRLRLVPRAHRLTLVTTQEIFMDQSVPEIIQQKLALVGLSGDDVAMRLVGSYPKREFVVQYKESDLAFISRLAEHEGISFFFEHDGHDRMVFTDHNDGFHVAPGHATARFCARGERHDVYRIEATTRLVPRVHVVHDYNYRSPQVHVSGSAEAGSGLAGGVVEFGAHLKTPEEATNLARIRAEETEANHRVYTFQSDLAWMGSGGRFTLASHPKLDEVPLLVTAVEHSASQPVVLHHGAGVERPYGNVCRAVEASRPYRPPRATPKPRIDGVSTGIIAHEVEGTESLFARMDDQGRYLVRMMFDTSQPGERQAVSRRIRMAQPHSGPNYGIHFPLKPGTEVLIVCVDGDPDRPIIVATVPNPLTSSPVTDNAAPAHRIKTATGILIEMKDA